MIRIISICLITMLLIFSAVAYSAQPQEDAEGVPFELLQMQILQLNERIDNIQCSEGPPGPQGPEGPQGQAGPPGAGGLLDPSLLYVVDCVGEFLTQCRCDDGDTLITGGVKCGFEGQVVQRSIPIAGTLSDGSDIMIWEGWCKPDGDPDTDDTKKISLICSSNQ